MSGINFQQPIRDRLQSFGFHGEIFGKTHLYWSDQSGKSHAFSDTTLTTARKLVKFSVKEEMTSDIYSLAQKILMDSDRNRHNILAEVTSVRKDTNCILSKFRPAETQWIIALVFIREFVHEILHTLEIFLRELSKQPKLIWHIQSLSNDDRVYDLILNAGITDEKHTIGLP